MPYTDFLGEGLNDNFEKLLYERSLEKKYIHENVSGRTSM